MALYSLNKQVHSQLLMLLMMVNVVMRRDLFVVGWLCSSQYRIISQLLPSTPGLRRYCVVHGLCRQLCGNGGTRRMGSVSNTDGSEEE